MALKIELILFAGSIILLTSFLTHYLLAIPHDIIPSVPKQKHKYPTGVPDKFDPDGNVQHFPGNTIIIHLSNTSELYASLMILYDTLSQKSSVSHLYTLLPPSSWHMTVFEGVVDKIRKPGYWPANLALDAPLEECTQLYEKELSSFSLATPLPYNLTIPGYQALVNGIALDIQPQSTSDVVLRNLRDRLSEVLQIKQRDHETYGFHVSVAYFLRYPDDDQKNELMRILMNDFVKFPNNFELGRPEFCRFEDMFAFERILYLENW
jgi:hypothetical protein